MQRDGTRKTGVTSRVTARVDGSDCNDSKTTHPPYPPPPDNPKPKNRVGGWQ